jgi:hypothetical protein
VKVTDSPPPVASTVGAPVTGSRLKLTLAWPEELVRILIGDAGKERVESGATVAPVAGESPSLLLAVNTIVCPGTAISFAPASTNFTTSGELSADPGYPT